MQLCSSLNILGASLVAQRVKHLPTMWETRVQFLGWEDPLEKETATHSSTLAGKIPWTEKCGRLQSVGSQSLTRLSDFTFTFEYSLALPFFGIGMKTDFSSPVATAEFSKCAGILSAALSQHHLSGPEIAQLESHHLH